MLFEVSYYYVDKLDQGRKWLPKTGGASSNTSSNVAGRRLLFCQKVGGQLPPPPDFGRIEGAALLLPSPQF